MQDQIKQTTEPFHSRLLEDNLAALPAEVRDDLRAASALSPDKRNEFQKYLAEKFKTTMAINDRDCPASFPNCRRLFSPFRRSYRLCAAN